MARFNAVAGGRWSALNAGRQAHLNRARKCSALTLPSLLPPEDSDENTVLETPWQTMGARGTNTLASKLVLSLMPPNSPCMRFIVDQEVLDMMQGQGGPKAISDLEATLSKREWSVQQWMEKSRIRVPSFRIMRLLIVTGNALIYRHPSNILKVFRLDQYVVRRNGQGQPVEIVTHEKISPDAVPAACRQGKEDEPASTRTEMVSMFTYCRQRAGKWKIHQEINGQLVPDSKGEFTEENFPFQVLVWSLADGENYGRGHVEEHLGDLLSLEELTKALVESTAASAKLIFLVNPNGVTKKRDLISTPNGGFATGVQDDVQALRVEKQNDLSVCAQEIQALKDGLSHAFLMHTSIQRQGERVTAEEIRFMAQDIEDGLGGIYSILAQEYQLPLVKWALKAMEKAKIIDPLPPEITVSITTGLESLGRGHDLQKLNSFMQQISFLSPDVLMKYMNIGDYLKRVATSLAIDTQGLIKTETEIQQEMAEAQKQAQGQRMAEYAMNSPVAAEVTKGMVAGGGQPQQ